MTEDEVFAQQDANVEHLGKVIAIRVCLPRPPQLSFHYMVGAVCLSLIRTAYAHPEWGQAWLTQLNGDSPDEHELDAVLMRQLMEELPIEVTS